MIYYLSGFNLTFFKLIEQIFRINVVIFLNRFRKDAINLLFKKFKGIIKVKLLIILHDLIFVSYNFLKSCYYNYKYVLETSKKTLEKV